MCRVIDFVLNCLRSQTTVDVTETIISVVSVSGPNEGIAMSS